MTEYCSQEAVNKLEEQVEGSAAYDTELGRAIKTVEHELMGFTEAFLRCMKNMAFTEKTMKEAYRQKNAAEREAITKEADSAYLAIRELPAIEDDITTIEAWCVVDIATQAQEAWERIKESARRSASRNQPMTDEELENIGQW